MSATMENVNAPQVSGPKTLPMKYKCMMYGAIALLESLKQKGITCDTNFMEIVHMEVSEQMRVLDEMVDPKQIENDVIKPLKKERKKEIAAANKPVKEKKPRAPRKKKEPTETAAPTATVPTATTEEETPKVTVTVTVNRVDVPTEEEYDRLKKAAENNEELCPEWGYEEVAKISSEPIPIGMLASVAPEPVPAKEEKAKKPKAPRKKKDATSEDAAATTEKKEVAKEEKAKKPKTPRKKKEEVASPVPAPAPVPETPAGEEKEFWLIMHEGQRYWTTDSQEYNGELYSCGKDSDGDNAPDALIGHIVNGEIVFKK